MIKICCLIFLYIVLCVNHFQNNNFIDCYDVLVILLCKRFNLNKNADTKKKILNNNTDGRNNSNNSNTKTLNIIKWFGGNNITMFLSSTVIHPSKLWIQLKIIYDALNVDLVSGTWKKSRCKTSLAKTQKTIRCHFFSIEIGFIFVRFVSVSYVQFRSISVFVCNICELAWSYYALPNTVIFYFNEWKYSQPIFFGANTAQKKIE